MSVEELIQAAMRQAERARAENTQACLTQPQYKCPECQDTGWIRCELPNGYSGVKECTCQKARRAESLMKKSGLGNAIQECTFDAFQADTAIQQAMKTTAENYLGTILGMDRDTPRKPWLYIGGNPGTGKTHICTAICGELLRCNREVVYMQWSREARRLKALVNEPDFDRDIERFTDCEILYVDDLFKQTYRGGLILTEADIKLAFSVLNARYTQDLPTMITSEWTLEQLLEQDEGVFSRVYERCKEFTLTIPRDTKYNYRLMRHGKGA